VDPPVPAGAENPGWQAVRGRENGGALSCEREPHLPRLPERSEVSAAVLRAILESPKNYVIFALDRGYRYITFNRNHARTMKRIWGVEIAPGRNMLEVIGRADDREKARQNFDRALRGEHFTLVEAYGSEEHERRIYENTYSPILDEQGRVIGLTVFLVDITEETAVRHNLELYQSLVHQALGGREEPEAAAAAAGRQLLVVEDDPVVQRLLRLLLRDLGCEAVVEASSGEEALDQLRRDPEGPGLVLLDLGLPGMSGAATLQVLRRERPGLPVVVLSGDPEAAEGLDADAVLEKPFETRELEALLRRFGALGGSPD